MEKALALNAILLLLSICMRVTYSLDDPVSGTCSNAVIVLTKEEMKQEIKSQLTEACACNMDPEESLQNCSANYMYSNVIQKLDEISKKLDTTMNKLISLHLSGKTASHPAMSCAEIYDYNPTTPSGYYWLKDSNDTATLVFCDMTLTCKGVGGGWMQVVKLDMTNSSHQCPTGTRLRTDLTSKKVCGINFSRPGCSSTTFDVHGIEYTQVCGKIIAYQDASPDAFGAVSGQSSRSNVTLDGNYVDGISLTHGANPRKHVWTFAAALDEVGSWAPFNCPCTNVNRAASASQPPSFVGNDYFCDTGSTHTWAHNTFYNDDPLWDGAGCGPANTCCTLNNPPWFRKQLPFSTTDDIEMRMCRDHPPLPNDRPDEDTPIEILELYVR